MLRYTNNRTGIESETLCILFDTRHIIFHISGMTRLNTAEYKFILIVVFLNFNLLLLLSFTLHLT